jgi:hypothetical protein
MKFDIFNESTWTAATQLEIEDRITNKALGAIGQKIHEMRMLRERLTSGIRELIKSKEESEAYIIASELLQSNPEAAKEMNVEISYDKVEVKNIIQIIDKTLEFWKDTEARRYRWRELLPELKQLEPYLPSKNGAFSYYHRDMQESLAALAGPKVTGNKAWECYLNAETARRYFHAKYKAAQDKLDEPPESEEIPDSDYDPHSPF